MTFIGDYMNICLIGNSKRTEVLYENLINSGYQVVIFRATDELPDEIKSDWVILPVPTITAQRNLNLSGEEITMQDLMARINTDTPIISCNYNSSSHKIIDLNKQELFTYLNAIPTAEGAIEIAIRESDKSLAYSSALITGFGHVGKVLADRLKGLFGSVTIAARSDRDLSYAQALGYDTANIYKLYKNIHKFDVIFQTVPSMVLDKKVIGNMKEDSFVIELSSASIGTDFLFAEKTGRRIAHAPALPTKVAPKTAGEILTKSVLSIIVNENALD